MGKWLDKLRAESNGTDGCSKIDKENCSERVEEHVGLIKLEGGSSQDASKNLVDVRQPIKVDGQRGGDLENRATADIAFGEFGVDASCKQRVIHCLECRHYSPGDGYGAVICAAGNTLDHRVTRWTRRYCPQFERS